MRVLAAEPNPVLPIWQEMVVGLVAFGVLYFVLRKYVFPRMEETFRARADAIEGGIRRAEEKQAEAQALFEQYQRQLADARSEAAVIRDQARADANAVREDILEQARQEADRIIAAGRDQLEAQRTTILREVRVELGDVAVELASRIVGESLADEARQRGTIDRFLGELETSGGR